VVKNENFWERALSFSELCYEEKMFFITRECNTRILPSVKSSKMYKRFVDSPFGSTRRFADAVVERSYLCGCEPHPEGRKMYRKLLVHAGEGF